MTYTINKTQNGIVFKCDKCNKIHFEYNNLNFLFTSEQFYSFSDYILELDADYWENKNQHSPHNRKIFVPVGHKNLKLGFHTEEIEELQSLLGSQKENTSVLNLKYQYSDN